MLASRSSGAAAYAVRVCVQGSSQTLHPLTPLASSSTVPSFGNTSVCTHKRMWRAQRLESDRDEPRAWSPQDANNSQDKHIVAQALAKDLRSALRVLRACHDKASSMDGVDIAIKLDLGSTKKTRVTPVSGSIIFPNKFRRKQSTIAVIGNEDELADLKAAGADIAITFEEFGKQIKDLKFDDLMAPNSLVGDIKKKYAKVLRSKVPSKKNNMAVHDSLEALKTYRDVVRWKCDKMGIVDTKVSQLRFSDAAIVENLQAIVRAVKETGPEDRIDSFVTQITLTTTMGPGIKLDADYLMDLDPQDPAFAINANALQQPKA